MEQNSNTPDNLSDAPIGIVSDKKVFSLVWLVPIMALIIGSWLVYKTVSEKGPLITITFKNADGLEAGKTKVKYKNVDVGQVESLHLSENLSEVVLKVRLKKNMESFLRDQTHFWVVRAKVGAGEISGLSTLFSGAYIGISPIKEGEKTIAFTGLEKSPVIEFDAPGRFFNLKSESLGSLDIGSPIYYRHIEVGQVVNYELNSQDNIIDVRIFVEAPHHKHVLKNTRFWDAGGLDVSLDPSGIQINTESLTALMIGGVAFDSPKSILSSPQAEEDETFILYSNRKKVGEPKYTQRKYYLLYFNESTRGLSVGAPVELRGTKIGEVIDIKLEFAADELAFYTPVLIAIEPERIKLRAEDKKVKNSEPLIKKLIEKGLRAQLKTGMLLTGQLFIELDIHPDEPFKTLNMSGRYPEVPTIETRLEQVSDRIAALMERVEQIPLEQIGKDLASTISNANQLISSKELKGALVALEKSMVQIEAFSNKLNHQVTPKLNSTLEQTRKTLATTENFLNEDSQLSYDLHQMLQELSKAAKSIQELADYMEKHPDSLIYGKGDK